MKILDTHVCSHLLHPQPRRAIARVGSLPLDELSISAVVAAELRVGAAKRQSPSLTDSVERFLHGFAVRPWPIEVRKHYAHLRAELERTGQPIGGMDLLIAAHAIAENATLITNNVREFERVPNLQNEAWE